MDRGNGTIGITERYDIYADFKRFETGRLAIGLKILEPFVSMHKINGTLPSALATEEPE